jgi:hypothetical protein
MFRFRYALLFTTAMFCLSLCANAATPADQIFPDSTKGFVSIRNLKDFGEQWKKTQFGQLLDDPLAENFKKELQKQLTERMEQPFGLTLDGITSLPSGEVAFGMIAIPNQTPGFVLTMDVTGKRKETDAYLNNLTQKLVAAGVKKSTEVYKQQQITLLTFPPPPPPPAAPQGATKVEINIEPIQRKAFYMFLQDILIASDQIYLLKLIADRIADQPGKALANVESYQTVMKRCNSDTPQGIAPAISWYIEPLDYGESIRVLQQGPVAQNRREKLSVFTILKQQGFDAIRGIGGTVSVKTEAQESVYRTFIYAPKPHRLAMKMLNFPDNTNFAPPAWMPSDLARCTMLYIDPMAIFDNFGVLFDALMSPGEEGMWKDILHGLRTDPHGPRIDVREELAVNLGNRILGMSRYEKPITVKSESVVVAVELKAGREAAMLAGLEKLFGRDPEMMATQHKTYKIWHRKPIDAGGFIPEGWDDYDPFNPNPFKDDGIPDIFSTNGSIAQPAATVETVLVVQRGNAQPANNNNANGPAPVFPEGGVVVAKGCLFVSTNIEYLKLILDRLDSPAESALTTIGNESEYKEVDRIFAGMGLTNKPHFFQFFARTHETLRPTYEVIRHGQMAQSQALLGKLLNAILTPQDEEPGMRPQVLDGSSLPEFDKVQHYFGKVGIFGMSEENGYYIKGFALEREKK